MGKKGPLWWRESDWLLRGSSAANQILLRHSGPILSFTARKRSCGKVMFLHLTVSHSVHRAVCMVEGACVVGGMHGRGRAWQERWPPKRAVRIQLECILVYCTYSHVHLTLQTFSTSFA